MRNLFSTFLIMAVCSFASAQKELLNKYNSYSEVHGGMEDGGISRTESFVFVAYASLELKEIYYEGKTVFLKKGDSVVVDVSKYIPYNNDRIVGIDSNQTVQKVPEIKVEDRFTVTKIGRTYYLNVREPYVWQGTLVYVVKKNLYVAKIKAGFDDGSTHYAP